MLDFCLNGNAKRRITRAKSTRKLIISQFIYINLLILHGLMKRFSRLQVIADKEGWPVADLRCTSSCLNMCRWKKSIMMELRYFGKCCIYITKKFFGGAD